MPRLLSYVVRASGVTGLDAGLLFPWRARAIPSQSPGRSSVRFSGAEEFSAELFLTDSIIPEVVRWGDPLAIPGYVSGDFDTSGFSLLASIRDGSTTSPTTISTGLTSDIFCHGIYRAIAPIGGQWSLKRITGGSGKSSVYALAAFAQ
jgi:hypothetical protein